MADHNDEKEFYSCPADRSLEAYKRWRRELMQKVGILDDFTDAEFGRGWREFWAAAGNRPRRKVGLLEQKCLAIGAVPMSQDIVGWGIIGGIPPKRYW